MDDSDSEWKRWLTGVLCPLGLVFWGAYGLQHRSFTITLFRFIDYPMTGLAAIAASLGSIALGVFCYWFLFWLNSDNPPRIRTAAVVVSAICFLLSAITCGLALFRSL